MVCMILSKLFHPAGSRKSFVMHQTEEEWVRVLPTTGTKLGYGYLWYIGRLNDHITHLAWGFGGQLIIIVPEDNLLVTTTVNSDVTFTQSVVPPDLIFDGIINVLLDGKSQVPCETI